MLRITQQSSSEAAKQYYAGADYDYYGEGQEIIGRWGGKGAELLGLEGRVSGREFNRLCDNVHPRSKDPLTARTKDERTVGYDFTFSVPKSVSLLYAMTEDKSVLDAFREAVHETMRDAEAEMKVRVRKKGRNAERVTGNMAWAEFVHTTSRPVDGIPDPQLHSHCFVFNASFDEQEQEWKAGFFQDLKRDAPFWQAAFRARLANRLQAMGYAIERKRDDFEVAGVPSETIRRFSRRTEKIEKLARERGIENPEAKARLGTMTREGKDKNLTWPELTREWLSRLTPQEGQAIDAVLSSRNASPPREWNHAAAVDFAVNHVFEREAVVPEKRLLTEALKHGLGTVTVEGVSHEYARKHLPVAEENGRRLVTTPEVLAVEDRLIAYARDGRGTCKPLGVPDRPLTREWLKGDQKVAVAHILGSRDRVMMVRGAAGAGKTTLLQEAAEGIAEGGHRLVVLAPSAGASRKTLRDEGFKEADTVARFLRSDAMQQQAQGQVIVVDEAGMLGNKDMAALFDIAEQRHARVILLGDKYQHTSVAQGTPLKLLEDEAGVPVVTVDEIIRQQGDYKRAVQLLSKGKTIEGFDELDKLGWIIEVPDEKRYLRLAEAYVQASAEKGKGGAPASVLVVTPTHAEAGRITDAIRADLSARSQLGEEREFRVWVPVHLTEAERGEARSYEPGYMLQFHQNAKGGFKAGQRLLATSGTLPLDQAARFQVYRPSDLKLATGDRLRVTANGKTADGHRINNGDLFTCKGFTPAGDIITDNGWVIGRDFGHVALGYAITSWASQSKTVDKVLIGESAVSAPASGRAGFYVEASRGRTQTLIFTDDKQSLREAVSRDRERLTATEVFGRPRPRGWERMKLHLSHLRRWAGLDWAREKSGNERTRAQREMSL
jgi:conjugative relaxase-like TrwC/TraI family protein